MTHQAHLESIESNEVKCKYQCVDDLRMLFEEPNDHSNLAFGLYTELPATVFDGYVIDLL